MSRKNKVSVVISTGDPAGIGPIISVKALKYFKNENITLIGDKAQLEQLITEIAPEYRDRIDDILKYSKKENINDIIPSDKTGKLSFEFFEKGVDIVLKNKNSVLVTAPISKELWLKGGIRYRGHTEYFDKRFDKKSIMFFYSDYLKVALFTHHIRLKDLWLYLKKEKLENFYEILYKELNKRFAFGWKFVSGSINPHAGEKGYMGDEETNIIIPVLKKIGKEKGIDIKGPFPNDTIFYKYKNQKDIVIISYTHDIGLSPFKLMNFFEGVNVTLNLPIVRTSPDHGTGFDLKKKVDINEKSMVKSIELAIKLKNNERK